MALVECPNCSYKIFDEAVTCPKCWCVVNEKREEKRNQILLEENMKNIKKKSYLPISFTILLILVVAFWNISVWLSILIALVGGIIFIAHLLYWMLHINKNDSNISPSNKVDNRQNTTSKSIETRLFVNGELQSITYSNADKLNQAQVDNDIRIMQDCLYHINNSKNIETVLNRFNDLLDVLTRMTSYERNCNVKHFKELPSNALIRMHDEQINIMNDAIKRSYKNELHAALNLKTEKGQINRMERYFKSLEPLLEKLPVESSELIKILMREYRSDLLVGNTNKQNGDIK